MTETIPDPVPAGQSATHATHAAPATHLTLGQRAGVWVDHVADGGAAIDPVAHAIAGATSPVAGPKAPEGLRAALSGAWLGHPLHPIVVTMPLGAWTLTALFDLLGERRAADLCLRVGVGAAGLAALSGLAQWHDVTGYERPRRIGTIHSLLNTAATGAYIGSWALRSSGRRGAGIATSLVGLGIVSASGWLGGHLSYTLGVGVEDGAITRQRRVGGLPSDDLGDGRPDPSGIGLLRDHAAN